MTYDLFIGDRLFSSWSLRGWLMLEKFGLPHKTHMIGLYADTLAEDLAPLHPARLVPVLRTPDGTVIGETMAIAETLAERHPDRAFWPAPPAARATARWLAAEMCTGFPALRQACPMQLRHRYVGFAPDAAVRADLHRLELLWQHARAVSQAPTGPLFGAYSLADVFFVPVAARIVGYGLPVTEAALAYCHDLLADPVVEGWRQQGLTVLYDPEPYTLDLPTNAWPVFHGKGSLQS